MKNSLITPNTAAKILKVNPKTVLRWCNNTVRGNPNKLKEVTRTASGRFYLDREEVRELAKNSSIVPD